MLLCRVCCASPAVPASVSWRFALRVPVMMIILLLFLQKQNLANAIYLQVTVSGERLSLGSLRGVCPCSLHRQWRVSIAWGSVRRAPVFASPYTISGESRSLWSLCGRHRAAVLLQKVNKNCTACELKLSRVWRAYAADGMRVCTSLSLCSWPWKL
jgi:hypothetical protein